MYRLSIGLPDELRPYVEADADDKAVSISASIRMRLKTSYENDEHLAAIVEDLKAQEPCSQS